MAARFVFLETPSSGTGESVTLLSSLGSLNLLLAFLDMRAFALSYYILLCHVLMLSLGGLFFSRRKQRGNGPGGWGR